VNAGINNDSVEEHIGRLFDASDARVFRKEIEGLSPTRREDAVVNKLAEVIKRRYAKYVLRFRFMNDDASRTSHYLMFVTKDPTGASIMKDILGKESTVSMDGMPAHVCSPIPKASELTDLLDPVENLTTELAESFQGRTITVKQLYHEHGLERLVTKKQYKQALLRLETAGLVLTDPAKRIKNTMADHVRLRFPKSGS